MTGRGTAILALLLFLSGGTLGAYEEPRGGYRIDLPPGWEIFVGPSSTSYRPGPFQDLKIVVRCSDVRSLWTGEDAARFLLRNERQKRQHNEDVQVLRPVGPGTLGGEPAWSQTLAYRDYIDEAVIHRKIVATARRNDETLTLVTVTIDASRDEWRKRFRELEKILASFRFLALPESPIPPIASSASPSSSPAPVAGGSYPTRLGGRRSPVYRRRGSKPVSAVAGWGGTLPAGGGGKAPSAAGGGKGKGAAGAKGRAKGRVARGKGATADRYWRRMLRPERFFKPETLWQIGKKGWRDGVLETVTMSDRDASMYGKGAGPTDNSARSEAERKRAMSFFNPNLKGGR